MAQDKFFRCLHLVDNSSQHKKGEKGYDNVRSLMDHLIVVHYYQPGCHVSGDKMRIHSFNICLKSICELRNQITLCSHISSVHRKGGTISHTVNHSIVLQLFILAKATGCLLTINCYGSPKP